MLDRTVTVERVSGHIISHQSDAVENSKCRILSQNRVRRTVIHRHRQIVVRALRFVVFEPEHTGLPRLKNLAVVRPTVQTRPTTGPLDQCHLDQQGIATIVAEWHRRRVLLPRHNPGDSTRFRLMEY